MIRNFVLIVGLILLATGSTLPAAADELLPTHFNRPLSFEANTGQLDEAVRYISRGVGYSMFFTPAGVMLDLPVSDSSSYAVQMAFVGGNPAPVIAAEGQQAAGYTNYFIGNDPADWRSRVPLYDRVRYQDIYPGVDVVFYGRQETLEYDFVVAPGVDPSVIEVQFEGADGLAIGGSGDLLLTVGDKTLTQQAPYAYQNVAGQRVTVDSAFVLETGGRLHFALGAYDSTRPLFIDPELVYSTYFGGAGTDKFQAIAVDSTGHAYLAGGAGSSGVPTTVGAYDPSPNGGSDVMIVKLDTDGTALIYSTYLGGSGNDYGYGLAVDATGNVYVTGSTVSPNFPTTAGAYQTARRGNTDAFVAKLNAAGSALVYSTYLGGATNNDTGRSLAVDNSGNVYVTGEVTSTDFPTTPGAYATHLSGLYDAFVTKLNPAGSDLVYSTYLGGGSDQKRNFGVGIAVDSSGQAYLAGHTNDTGFPTTAGAYQPVYGGGGGNGDIFITKLNAAGSGLVYSTYLGGSVDESCGHLAIDGIGNVYVTGGSSGAGFPKTTGAYDVGNISGAFVTKLNPDGSDLIYSTRLGGANVNSTAMGVDIAIDPSGNAYVTGQTTLASGDAFPTTVGAYDSSYNGGTDVFITELNAAGSALLYSTYLGSAGSDYPTAIAIDSNGGVYVAGSAYAADFPTTAGAYDPSYNGGYDAVVTRFQLDPPPPTTPTSVTESGGATDNAWQPSVDNPFFTWSGATDGDGSGIKNYDAYWGSDPTGETVTATVTDPAYTPAGPVSEGTTYLRLRTRNNTDAVSDWATAFTFKYDATPPALPAGATETAAGCSGWCNQLDVAFSWAAATDSDSGVAGYEVYWGPDPTGNTPTATPAGLTYDPPATDGSSHYLRLRARDNAGNDSGWGTVYSYQYDGTPPANPDTATAAGGLNSGDWSHAVPVFTLSGGSDAAAGIAGYTYYFGPDAGGVPDTFSAGDVITPTVSGNGAYYLRVEAVDAAGNPAGSVADLFTFKYDTAAPAAPTSVVENHGLSSGGWSNVAPVFTLSGGSDEESGLAGYVYYFGFNASGTPATFSASPMITPTLSGNGVYYLRVVSRDNAGNESPAADLFTFKYDTAAPTHPTATESHALTSNVWQNSVNSPSFELNGADDGAGSGVAAYDLYWGSSAAGTTVTTHTTGSSYTPPAVTAGTSCLRARTYDQTGNVSAWQTLFIIKYDDTPPANPTFITEGHGVISGTWQAAVGSPTFTWNASLDNSGGSGTAGYDVYWGSDANGSPAVTQVSSPTFAPGAITPGTPTYLRLRAYDQVGNASAWVTAFDFRYDQAPAAPTVITETHSLTSATWQNSVAAPAFTWEPVADAVSYDVYWGTDSGGITVVTTTTSAAYTPGPVANGLFYLRLRSRTARDITSAWVTAFVFKFDNTPPAQVKRVDVTEAGDAPDSQWQSVTGDASFAWPVPGDTLAGVAKYRVYWGTDPAGTSTSEQTSPTYDPPAIAGGSRYLRLKSYDNAGNATQWQTLFEFKYDGDPPAVTLESPPFYPAALSFDVRWAVSDVASGPGNCTVSWAVASRTGDLVHNQPYSAVKMAQFFENLAGSDVALTASCADQAGLTTVVTRTTTIVAAITDGDSDELPDVWETANSLNPADPADAAGDPDSDELTNLQEYQHGTDPRQLDTDGDGLSDYDEVYSLWAGSLGVMADATTTPILWDSDGDGLGDGLEVTMGSDPLNDHDPYDPAVDSDGDGLPDGWESYYSGAGEATADPDGDGLDNLGEYQRHTSPLTADTDHDGLSDGAEVNSAGTDPNAWDTDRDRFPDSMEIADATDPTDGNDSPLVSDQDHDGMNDAWETTNGVSDPAADADGDGLDNLAEYQAGTDPHLTDTDRDGYTDKTEVDAGSDPLDPASTPNGPPDGVVIYLPVVIK